MTKRLWIYPALFCLLLSIALTGSPGVPVIIICVIWFIRIVLLKHRPLLIITCIIGLLSITTFYFHKKDQQTVMKGTETTLLVYPDVTSIKVDGDSIRLNGTVVSPMNASQKEKIVIRYYVETEKEKARWLNEPPDNFLILKGELDVPGTPSNFYQFDYKAYLKRRGIHWQFNAETVSIASSNGFSKPVSSYINTFRLQVLQAIDQACPPKVASYMKSLFFADRRGLSEEILSNYRSLGIIHFFSISGFHINFIIKCLTYMFLRLGITHERTNVVLIFLIPLYGLIAGWGISIFRAVFQAVFQMLGKLMNKDFDSMDAWSMTMLLALFINPFQIYDIAFQLSYALSGLLIIESKQAWMHKLNPWLSSLLFSFLASIVSIPILSYHFFEISWITLFANLLFLPFFSYILFPALIVLLVLMPLLTGTRLLYFLNEALETSIHSLECILQRINDTVDFSWVTGRLPQIIMLVLILCVFCIIKRIENKKRPAFISLSGLLLCISYYQISPLGYVTMLDVGQGDSILIKDPTTRKISLIDTGGQANWRDKEDWQLRQNDFSIGQDVIVPALKAFGVSAIDYLYITHADVDHSGEIASIGQEIDIKEIITTEETFRDGGIHQQIAQLERPTLTIALPPEIVPAPFEQTLVIHPMEEFSNSNNHSLVMYGKIGGDSWLFTGDIEAEVEDKLLVSYPNLTTDYLKVAHHGSNSSSTDAFIKHIQPHTALISAGKNNSFGHPHLEVLGHLEKENVRIYQTNEVGAVRVMYMKWPVVNSWYKKLDTVHTD